MVNKNAMSDLDKKEEEERKVDGQQHGGEAVGAHDALGVGRLLLEADPHHRPRREDREQSE